MFSPGKHHLSHLLLTVLLLGGQTADGAQNGSEVETASVHSSRAIVAKEGSSILIECNVTGGHDSIMWLNPKGLKLGDDAGKRRKLMECGEIVIEISSFCGFIGQPKGHPMYLRHKSIQMK